MNKLDISRADIIKLLKGIKSPLGGLLERLNCPLLIYNDVTVGEDGKIHVYYTGYEITIHEVSKPFFKLSNSDAMHLLPIVLLTELNHIAGNAEYTNCQVSDGVVSAVCNVEFGHLRVTVSKV